MNRVPLTMVSCGTPMAGSQVRSYSGWPIDNPLYICVAATSASTGSAASIRTNLIFSSYLMQR